MVLLLLIDDDAAAAAAAAAAALEKQACCVSLLPQLTTPTAPSGLDDGVYGLIAVFLKILPGRRQRSCVLQ